MSNGTCWMPLYVGDYLRDTGHLSTAEHGCYLLLLMHAWGHSGLLPLDENRLRRIGKMDAKEWAAARDTILEFFYPAEDGYRQKRVERELERAQAVIEQKQDDRKANTDRMRRWRQDRAIPEREWFELRASIFKRDGGKCTRCGSPVDLHCDHIRELRDGGTNDPDNLTTLCRTCHSKKTGKTKSNGHAEHDVTHHKPPGNASQAHHKPHDVTVDVTRAFTSTPPVQRLDSYLREGEETARARPSEIKAVAAGIASALKAWRPPFTPSREFQLGALTVVRGLPQPQEPERTVEEQLAILRGEVAA